MLGSTIVSEVDIHTLLQLGDDLDKIDTLNFINLNTMTTLDFCILLNDKEESWVEHEPVFYNENQGLVIVKINEKGLKYILSNPFHLNEEQEEDINRLKRFIENNGLSNNYEVTTF